MKIDRIKLQLCVLPRWVLVIGLVTHLPHILLAGEQATGYKNAKFQNAKLKYSKESAVDYRNAKHWGLELADWR